MPQIKFGPNQLTNPTPSTVNLVVRVFTVSAGIFMGWMATANVMGPNTKDLLNSILGLLLALANGLAPLFGIDLSNTRYVKAEDVTAVDEKAVKED
jgi:hypothetical protein